MKAHQYFALAFVLLLFLEIILVPEAEAWGRRRRRRRRRSVRRRRWFARRRRSARRRRWARRRRSSRRRRRGNWFRKGLNAVGRGFKKAGQAIGRGLKTVGKAIVKGVTSKVGRYIISGVMFLNGIAGNICCLTAPTNPYSPVCCVITKGIAAVGCAASSVQLVHSVKTRKSKTTGENIVGIGGDTSGVVNNCVQAFTGGTVFGHADKKWMLTAKGVKFFKKGGAFVGRQVTSLVGRIGRGKRAVNGTTTEAPPKRISKTFAARYLPGDSSKLKLMTASLQDLYDYCRKRSRNAEMKTETFKILEAQKKFFELLESSGSKILRQTLADTSNKTVAQLEVCRKHTGVGGPSGMFHKNGAGESYNPKFQPCRLHPPTREEAAQLGGLRMDGPAVPSDKATKYCDNKMLIGNEHLTRIRGLLFGDVLNTFGKGKRLVAAEAALVKEHDKELTAKNAAERKANREARKGKRVRKARSLPDYDELLESVLLQ